MPEYLDLFSNQGEFLVKVSFEDRDISIRHLKCNASELISLINPSNGIFFECMGFDGHPYKIGHININLINRKITIKAIK